MINFLKNIFLLALLLFAGCNSEDAPDLFQTRGSYVEETRSIGRFSGINACKGIDVILQQGDEPGLLIKGWKNLLPDVRIEVDNDGILQLKDENKYNFVRGYNNRTTVYATYALQPDYFRAESDANIQVLDTLRNAFTFIGEEGGGEVSFLVNNPSVSVGVNGMITVRMSGKTNWLGITNWGWAPLHFENLPCLEASVSHHGPSDIFVNVCDVLNAELFALGNVYYSGNPAVNETRHGKGRVYQQ